MNRFAYLLIALAACTSSSDSTEGPAAEPAKPATVKPTASAAAPPNDAADLADLVALAKSGPGVEQFPQADAVVALDRDDITLGKDNVVVEHHRSIVKLLDAQRGKEKFADLHIPFDTKRQTLVLAIARTVTADGVAHVVAPEEIGDIVPPRIGDATLYSDVRERVVSFPAVDKDAVVELEWTRTTKATPDATFGGELLLGTWDPIVSRVVTLTAPDGVVPKFAIDGVTLSPAETHGDGTHTYTFSQANLPDRHPESGQPIDAAVLPRLVYGFAPDWNHVLAPVADRFLRAAVPSPLPAAVKAQADALVAGAKSDTERARALYKFVAHDIRSIDLPLGWAGYEPHAPDVVLANRYADDRDKVGLLLALCAAEKLDGRPVFVRTGKVPVIAAVPTLAQFDRMIARLTIDGKEVWLDPNDENGQYNVAFAGQDNLVLPVERNGAELGKRQALDPSASVSHVTATYALAENGDLDAKYAYEMTGWFADRASEELRPLKGDNLGQYFQQHAARISAGAVDKGHDVGDTLSVTGPIQISQHVAVTGYAQSQGGFRVLELPAATLDFANELPAHGLSVRKYPLWIGTPRAHTEDLSVTVPAGWKVAYVPPDLKGEADGVSFDERCQVAGQTITCHAQLVLDKLELAVDKYSSFHDALAKLGAYERRIVLLTKV